MCNTAPLTKTAREFDANDFFNLSVYKYTLCRRTRLMESA